MKRIAIIVALLILLSSCDHDEVKNRTIFKFTIDPVYELPAGQENWIIVRDDNDGQLVDAMQINIGGTVTFESRKKFANNKLSVTFLQIQARSGQARVYTEIPVGSEWTLGYTEYPLNLPGGQYLGSYKLNINSIPSPFGFALSDKFGAVSAIFAQTESTITASDVSIRTGAFFQLITSSTSLPKYKELSGINADTTINVDFNTFKDFDKVIKVAFAPAAATARVWGYEKTYTLDAQYVLFDNNRFGGVTPVVSELNLGFLNYLSNYKIDLTVGNFTYQSRGPAPTSIQVTPSDDFAITSSASMLDYTVTSSKDYSYKTAEYYSNSESSYFVVRYYSKKDGSKHHEPLTQELMDKYLLKLDDFKFDGTHFILDDTYDDFIDRNYNPKRDKTKPYVVSTVFTSN
jgi:hypothetical protein